MLSAFSAVTIMPFALPTGRNSAVSVRINACNRGRTIASDRMDSVFANRSRMSERP